MHIEEEKEKEETSKILETLTTKIDELTKTIKEENLKRGYVRNISYQNR